MLAAGTVETRRRSAMSEEVVLLNVDARGVATVTINRPAVNNA